MIDLKIKMDQAAAAFRAIDSAEIASHVGKAFQEAVEHGRDRMRARIPEILGRDVRGPGGVTGRFGQPTERTINAIQSTRQDWRSLRSLNDIKAKLFVSAQQGRVGWDQASYLKFQFGEGPQIRKPNDVGMDGEAIRIPQGPALLLTQKMRINPYHVGGRQAPGILSKVKQRAASSGANFFESPAEKLSQAMSFAARTKDAKRGRTPTPEGFARELARQHAASGMARIEAKTASFDHAGVLKATQSYVRSKKVGVWWDVYEGQGRNGVPTFFARPPRVRDPAGGKHEIRRKKGKSGWMPNMISVAPEYGEAGPQVGPRLLFNSLRQAAYQPKLQRPWDECIDAAIAYLDLAIQGELDHALERKSQGRSY